VSWKLILQSKKQKMKKEIFYWIEEYYNEISTDDKKLKMMSKVNWLIPSKYTREELIKANMKVFVSDCIDWVVL